MCRDNEETFNGNKLGYYTTANGQQYFNVLGNIEHIHGTLEREMILGVNDVEQIADKRFSENLFYRQFMIKEDANRRFAQNKIERVKELIDNSKIIIILECRLVKRTECGGAILDNGCRHQTIIGLLSI